MTDTEEIALAQQLYKIYYEALGNDRWTWLELAPNEREAWIQVSQFILAGLDNEPDHK